MHKIIIDDVNNLFEEGMHTRVPPRFFFWGGGGLGSLVFTLEQGMRGTGEQRQC